MRKLQAEVCRAVLAALDTRAEAERRREAKDAEEKALANERLRQSGRYGILMADD